MAEPSTAKRLTVHARLGSVGLVTLPHRLLPTVCCVLLSHSEQPMVQPCENQRHGWPFMPARVPGVQLPFQLPTAPPSFVRQPSPMQPQLQL